MKTVLSFSQCGTSIPYFDPEQCDPSQRHEFVNLRENPASVDELPELTQEPQLKAYLLQINRADTIFQTFGCDFSFSPGWEEVIGVTAPGEEPQTHRQADDAHSYIHVGFADLTRCTQLDDYYRLAGRLCKHLHEQPNLGTSEDDIDYFDVEIRVETLQIRGEEKGFVLNIICKTSGWDEHEARGRWSELMAAISTFLANEKLQ